MKRDMQLIHKILQTIEEHPGTGMTFEELDAKLLEGKLVPAAVNESMKRKERRQYHVHLLIDAKLITVWSRDRNTSVNSENLEYQLTWAGHEYVDGITTTVVPNLKPGDRVRLADGSTAICVAEL